MFLHYKICSLSEQIKSPIYTYNQEFVTTLQKEGYAIQTFLKDCFFFFQNQGRTFQCKS